MLCMVKGHHPSLLHDLDFAVVAEYRGSCDYLLTAVADDGSTAHPVHASCRLEEGAGQEAGDVNLIMTGFLEDKRVVANVTTVGDKLYVFTSVSYKTVVPCSLSSL